MPAKLEPAECEVFAVIVYKRGVFFYSDPHYAIVKAEEMNAVAGNFFSVQMTKVTREGDRYYRADSREEIFINTDVRTLKMKWPKESSGQLFTSNRTGILGGKI